jgi:Zn finger protein HypA/HybF involved in hydrogenase expression
MTKTTTVKVVCLECQKKFTVSTNASPECPRCGGTDIDVREDPC